MPHTAKPEGLPARTVLWAFGSPRTLAPTVAAASVKTCEAKDLGSLRRQIKARCLRALPFLASLCFLLSLSRDIHAQCANPANAIVAENCLPGSPSSEWDVGEGSAGDPSIQGFADNISVNAGGTINFKINASTSAYTITIYRIGYYGGNGARKIASITPSVPLPQTQPACITDQSTGLIDCGNWAVTASWQVPTTAVSGVYFAHLLRNDNGGDSHIVFIVRNDSSHSAILYQTADESWQAYNYYGAGSLYSQATPYFDLQDRSYKVSYNRPFSTRGFAQEWATWIFGAEFAMIQWLESNGYDITYFTGIDADRSGTLIKNHKIYMDAGHDEYWTGPQRANVQAARDAGVNLAFFSGNTMFWKTRWENSIDGTNTANRTLVCYKETLAFAKIDPADPPTWTGTFRDPSFSPPADGNNPENSLIGTFFMVNGTGSDNDGSQQITVPSDDGKMRFWRNTAVAKLAAGASYTLPKGTLGYEWDVDSDNGSRPPGLFHLSTTTYSLTSDYLLDYGATYGAGTATHHLTLYRAPSGALVFSSGSIDWSWGLNSNHDNLFPFATPSPDVNMQQATVNLFADMGVQPGNLQSGLVAASASTDTTAPSSTITFPAAGSSITTGSPVTVTGTATDIGGVVAGVEVSVDNGSTWHPATGRASWTYTWNPGVAGTTQLMSRAVDDTGNLETPTHNVTVNVLDQTCPCSIWNSSVTPTTVDSGDGTAVEVGVKFRADANGSVIGVRFYKAAANTGTHIGHLWSDSGTLLATATFTGEGASGWQQVNFSSPVQVQANTSYVASYYAPQGHYSADAYFFRTAGVDDPPLHALQDGVDGADGVFFYPPSNTGGFPSSGNLSTNYWVDVVYSSSNTYNISGTLSGPGGAGATVTLSGSESLTTTADNSGNYSFAGVVNGSYTITPSNAGVTFSPANRQVTVNGAVVGSVNFTAVVTNPLSISGTITGGSGATVNLGGATVATTTADSSGNYSFTGLLNGSYTVTPVLSGYLFTPGTQSVTLSGSSAAGVNFAGQVCNCVSLWQPSTTPSVIDSNDGTPVELGVAFQSATPGTVVGLRFYKAITNTGTHIGHIWTSTGTLLGSATFTNETASGWQQVTFSSPITLAQNTTYIASYYAPAGHYSADLNYFATNGVSSAPLLAPQSTSTTPNGVYAYTSTPSGAFPSSSYNATNYWVDVVFAGAQSYTISGTVAGTSGATVTLSGLNSASTTTDSSGNYSFTVYPGSYSITPSLTQYVFVPGTQSVAVSSANLTGVNFTVPSLCPCDTIWTPATLPGTIDSNDALPYELGVKFRADNDGYILGVRFYKAATNTGTHLGHLWSPTSANPLSSATFTGESTSGWQQVLFPNPVPVSAATTYIASYFAPAGHYSVNADFFSGAGTDTPPLHALESGVDGANGVFVQSSTSMLPTSSYQDKNYWVDVIYATTSTHSIGGVITGSGAAGATLTLTGPTNATATADGNGNYTINGLPDGTYTITPSQAGYSFTPASQTITLSGAHNLSVNFVSSPPTFSVSGTISGGAGVTVALTGTSVPTQTTTADASGNFVFSGVQNGSYTVAPNTAGYAYSPTSQSVTVSSANVASVNFTATLLNYSLSGNLAGGAGATVFLSGTSNASTVADASGNFSFPNVTNGSYTITPATPGLVFSPVSASATVAGSNVTSVNFSVPVNCPCDTVWQPTSVPTVTDVNDSQGVELGVKFRSDTAGYVTGIRFYKSLANTGTHVAHLWSSAGSLLATATFTGETNSGWEQAFFSAPVQIAANTTYVASYFAPVSHYAADSNYFSTTGVDSPPLHALENGVDGPNGVYAYGTTGAFPVGSASSTNYWVDAVFVSSYVVSGTITGAAGANATVTLTGPMTFTTTADGTGAYSFPSVPNGTYTVTPGGGPGSVSPTSQSVTVVSSNVTVPAFAATGAGYTLSGTISGAGGNGATVTLSGAASATTTASSTGVYSFTGLANGSYTVTPANSGFSFSPASQPVTINNANGTANFTASAVTYTISGTITGAGGNGATVILSGAASATTTASSTGAYTFTGLANGSYTVTPTKAGYSFSPASQPVTIGNANGTANFTASTVTYTISGTISGVGGNGATVRLSGAATATVTASSTGAYTFTGLTNGSYTVTPSKTGYTFTPASQAVTISNANGTASFSTVTYTISGTISGAGGNGATVTLSGTASATTTASSTGTYTFTGLANGSYTVTPSKTGYSFSPASQPVTISNANGTANFTASIVTYTISGTISGVGGNGATVRLSGAATATVTASSTGAYTFTGLTNGSYTVTPSKTGYTFTPASQAVTISNANGTASFSTVTYTISGTISGAGGNGATVKLSGAVTATVTASSAGAYTFTSLTNGSYTITPSKTGYTFTPASQAVTISSANGTANFTASTATYTISGTISGTGGNGATVKLSGTTTATVTASSTGAYTFTGLASGSYTVTPSKTGYSFTPASQAVTISSANGTANFSTVTYTISGTLSGAGGNGATVKLSGAATATVTASSTGAYTFTGLANGSYTVTPTKTGYTFTPASQAVTVNNANGTANFSTTSMTISGTISGPGGNGATVKITGTARASTTASSTGAYTFTAVANGTYTVTPSKTGYTFSPASQSVTVNGSSATANFTSAVTTFSLTGTIGGTGGSGVTVQLTGAASAVTTSGSSGTYTFTALGNGTYTVTPSKTAYSFNPVDRVVTINNGNANAHFKAIAQSGLIQNTIQLSTSPLESALLSLTLSPAYPGITPLVPTFSRPQEALDAVSALRPGDTPPFGFHSNTRATAAFSYNTRLATQLAEGSSPSRPSQKIGLGVSSARIFRGGASCITG